MDSILAVSSMLHLQYHMNSSCEYVCLCSDRMSIWCDMYIYIYAFTDKRETERERERETEMGMFLHFDLSGSLSNRII